MTTYDYIYGEIGKRIHSARRKKRFTQERLADIVSMTRTSITNIEKGRQKLLVHTLYDLANALGVHPTELLPEFTEQSSKIIGHKLPKDLSKKEMSWFKSIAEGGEKHGSSKKGD